MNKKNLVILCALALAGSVFAQDANKADLQKTAAAPEIQKQFDQPDGEAIPRYPRRGWYVRDGSRR